jgi:multidrug resistance efflux pump
MKTLSSLSGLAGSAERAIAAHERAQKALHDKSNDLAKAVDKLVAAQLERAGRKVAAVVRICAEDHPATPGKKFSASAADDYAQVDPAYASYKQEVALLERAKALAEHDVEDAKAALDGAKLRAELAIALVRASVGAGS